MVSHFNTRFIQSCHMSSILLQHSIIIYEQLFLKCLQHTCSLVATCCIFLYCYFAGVKQFLASSSEASRGNLKMSNLLTWSIFWLYTHSQMVIIIIMCFLWIIIYCQRTFISDLRLCSQAWWHVRLLIGGSVVKFWSLYMHCVVSLDKNQVYGWVPVKLGGNHALDF